MKVSVVADESVDGPIVEALRSAGVEVVYIAEREPGIVDEDVLRLAAERQALLVTADTDFGERVYRKARQHAGVVLLRLSGLPAGQKATITTGVFERHADEMHHAFTVVTSERVRIRQLM